MKYSESSLKILFYDLIILGLLLLAFGIYYSLKAEQCYYKTPSEFSNDKFCRGLYVHSNNEK